MSDLFSTTAGLWLAVPGDFNLVLILFLFAMGLVGMEFATTFTHAMLPGLARRETIGRISGNGWAFGYLGGLVALVLMLVRPLAGAGLYGLGAALFYLSDDGFSGHIRRGHSLRLSLVSVVFRQLEYSFINLGMLRALISRDNDDQ